MFRTLASLLKRRPRNPQFFEPSCLFRLDITRIMAADGLLSNAGLDQTESKMAQSLSRLQIESVKQVPIPPHGVDYRGKIVLAPMVRSGELPTRLLALRYGADLVWGPETVDKSMIGTTRRVCERTGTIFWTRSQSNPSRSTSESEDVDKSEGKKENVLYRIHPQLEKGKLIFQIGTANPDLAVKAARLVAADVAGIDVNAGCPKPFSTSGGMGAALLKTPDKLVSILEALVKHIVPEFGIGISVKIRLLDTVDETEALVKRLCATGITGLTVHCRTTPMRPRERAIRDERLAAVKRVCHEAGVACLMNGDVENRDHATRLVDEYGVDGAMIATAAEKNPSVFRSEAEGGKVKWRDLVREYMDSALSVENRWGNTKFLLSQFIPGKHQTYIQITKCKNHEAVVRALGFEELLERARDLDLRCGLYADRFDKKAKNVIQPEMNMGVSMAQTATAVAA